MAKPTIKLNSPAGTPEEDKIYVIEYPSTTRIKVRKIDIDNEIDGLEKDLVLKQARRDELVTLRNDINKIK